MVTFTSVAYDNQTYALNAETGAFVWKVTTGYDQCIQASPGFANAVVYTGGSFDKNVYALDAATGANEMDLHDWRRYLYSSINRWQR